MAVNETNKVEYGLKNAHYSKMTVDETEMKYKTMYWHHKHRKEQKEV